MLTSVGIRTRGHRARHSADVSAEKAVDATVALVRCHIALILVVVAHSIDAATQRVQQCRISREAEVFRALDCVWRRCSINVPAEVNLDARDAVLAVEGEDFGVAAAYSA